jgi:hypothetical protein
MRKDWPHNGQIQRAEREEALCGELSKAPYATACKKCKNNTFVDSENNSL